jgi:hypothetical protein
LAKKYELHLGVTSMEYLNDRGYAEQILQWAESLNPGPWIDHSKHVASASERIAYALQNKMINIDPNIAYICGLLHDVGRYKGVTPSIVHSIDGYELLKSKGFDGTANVCITHSIPTKETLSIQGWNNLSYETQKRFTDLSKSLKWTIYDNIITLCDAVADSHGYCLIDQRLISVALRHGINEYSLKTWKKYFQIKKEIEQVIGESVYHLLPGIEREIFRKHN